MAGSAGQNGGSLMLMEVKAMTGGSAGAGVPPEAVEAGGSGSGSDMLCENNRGHQCRDVECFTQKSSSFSKELMCSLATMF